MIFEAFLAQLLNSHAPPVVPSRCPADMQLVRGTHSEYVQRLCLDFHQDHCFSWFPFLIAKEGKETPIDTCMDTYEWPNKKGELPVVMLRFVEAEKQCASVGKRVCTEYEWETACEGPENLAYPYGWKFEPKACNQAKPYKGVNEAKLASNDAAVRDAETKRLWQGEPSGAYPECKSPFGVMDLTGNVEEWVSTSRPEWPWRSALKGGYWSKPGSGCRGTNERHGPQFRFYEIGFRCCKDPS